MRVSSNVWLVWGALTLAHGCAAPVSAAPPIFPPDLDVESLLPARETTTLVVPSEAVDFPDTPIECGPGPGVLLSERSYINAILDRSGRIRAEGELYVYRALRRTEREAYERAFTEATGQIHQAREVATRAERYRSWVFVAGVVTGGLVAAFAATAVR